MVCRREGIQVIIIRDNQPSNISHVTNTSPTYSSLYGSFFQSKGFSLSKETSSNRRIRLQTTFTFLFTFQLSSTNVFTYKRKKCSLIRWPSSPTNKREGEIRETIRRSLCQRTKECTSIKYQPRLYKQENTRPKYRVTMYLSNIFKELSTSHTINTKCREGCTNQVCFQQKMCARFRPV